MPEKTELMKTYEKQHPGKYAVWRGRITKQFKKWKKKYKEIEKPSIEIKTEFEILLYLSISKLKDPTYNKIMKFCTSFNIKSNEVLKTILKKIRENDIILSINDSSDLKAIYKDLFELENLQLPLTIRIDEAFKIFSSFNFNSPLEMITFFKTLKKEFPELLTLSSSKHNQREDLITFKRLFPDRVKFKLNNRWIL